MSGFSDGAALHADNSIMQEASAIFLLNKYINYSDAKAVTGSSRAAFRAGK